MESMRDVDRVMEREIKKGSTPLQFEQLGFGDYSYNEIISKPSETIQRVSSSHIRELLQKHFHTTADFLLSF